MNNEDLEFGWYGFEVSPTSCDLDLDQIDSKLEWLQKFQKPKSQQTKIHERQRSERVSDEFKALILGLTKSPSDILNFTTEQFSEFTASLNSEQLQFCRDLRRKTINRKAAFKSRLKKNNQIFQLRQDYQILIKRKQKLLKEYALLVAERSKWESRVRELQEHIYDQIGYVPTYEEL